MISLLAIMTILLADAGLIGVASAETDGDSSPSTLQFMPGVIKSGRTNV
jgi:hypothetical protein